MPIFRLVLALACILTGWGHFAISAPPEAKRCFVVVEGTDDYQLVLSLPKIRGVIDGAGDAATLKAGLDKLGGTKVCEFPDRSVFFVKIGKGDTGALDGEITVDFQIGSPYGLVRRISRETGKAWRCSRSGIINGYGSSQGFDDLTRVMVQDYRGSIRGLLAWSIPKSYATLAMAVLCQEDGVIQIRQYGQNDFVVEQYPRDVFAEGRPKADYITAEEMEKEGTTLLRRPGESVEEYQVRFDKLLFQKMKGSR